MDSLQASLQQNIFCLPPPIYVAREENSKTTDNLCLLRSSKIL